MMNVNVCHEELSTQTPFLLNIPVTVIPKTLTAVAPTIPPTISPITPLPQQSTPTPTPTPTTEPTTISIPALLYFSSLFRFDQRVSVLEKELFQLKQVDYSEQLLKTIKSQIPKMVDAQLSTRLEDSIQKVFRSYTTKFEKKVNDERKRYIDLVENTITESLENVVLAKSSSYPKSTYKDATSLTEFKLKKILLDKMQKSKSYRAAQENRDLYNALVKSYKLDKDLFDSYGKAYSLKRDREDKDKDEDPLTRSDQGNQVSAKITDDQPNIEATSRDDWFKKPKRPPTPYSYWNATKTIDFRPPQTWISKIAKSEKPPLTFDELMSTPIDFLAYVMNNLNIETLTQEHLNNPEGKEYPFDLSKPLPLIENQGCQVVVVNYFINNDLEYLKGGSSSRKCTTSTTKTKDAKYDDIQGIEDIVPSYLEEIKVRREDQQLYKFKEERDDIFDLNVALRMFTRRVVILKRVEDLQLGVKIYQKKLNITKPETFRSDISKMTPYTAYNNPQGIIYLDKLKRNRLIRSDELYKFYDGTLTFVRSVLHDIASSLRMDYLPKRRWSKLDRKRSRIMIKAIDQQLLERRLMRNLEKFVGGRE
ncbi:hypothetical protein Tco_1143777 [Tanacetum coccineum]